MVWRTWFAERMMSNPPTRAVPEVGGTSVDVSHGEAQMVHGAEVAEALREILDFYIQHRRADSFMRRSNDK
jgi:hypothetical protein